MKRVATKIVIVIMLIPVIGVALNITFGWATVTFLSVIRTGNNIYLYKFDVWNYIQNLKNSFETVSNLSINWQTRLWNDDIINNLAYLTNIIIYIGNLLIYPFRVGGYLVINILAILGVDTISQANAGGLQWLVDTCKFARDMQLMYI